MPRSPLSDAVSAHLSRRRASFHTPGHKGRLAPPTGAAGPAGSAKPADFAEAAGLPGPVNPAGPARQPGRCGAGGRLDQPDSPADAVPAAGWTGPTEFTPIPPIHPDSPADPAAAGRLTALPSASASVTPAACEPLSVPRIHAAPSESGGWAALDLTELPDTGSLYDGGDVIQQAEQQAASAFGADLTLFSAGGCTLCIQTMLLLGGGRHVLMARNAHRSAMQAAALLDLPITWVWPKAGQITAEEIDAALSADSSIQSVYITSPHYYGVLADIPAIAAVCRRHGLPLLVDNAHGSHLGAFGLHPLQLGADMTADSAHKTLPVLTGGAYLHIRQRDFFAKISPLQAKAAMSVFGSTSPSYPVLVSLDRAAGWWQAEGAAAFQRLAARLSALPTGAFTSFKNLPRSLRDPVRLTLDCGDRDARAAAARLREWGIEPELADARYVVCIPTPWNTEEELSRLEQAVARLGEVSLPRCRSAAFSPAAIGTPPAVALSPRQALLSPKQEVPVRESIGRICGAAVCPCPPGVAALVPGEVVSAEMAEFLESCGIRRIVLANAL